MKEFNFCRIFIFGISFFSRCTDAFENAVPSFTVVSPRTDLEPPSIEVVFPNGIHDELVLTQYKLFKESKGNDNYIGHLKNTPGSSVAVTGRLSKPEDRMEITLLSEHNSDEMFEIDYFGKAKIVPVPVESRRKGHLMDYKEFREKGVADVNPENQKAIYERTVVPSNVVDIPSKLKAVLKIGYTAGFVRELKVKNEPEFPEYIETVMTHAQCRFNHPSLGTKIQFEVLKGFLYENNTSWCAEKYLGSARNATINARLPQNVDVTSWFADSESEECGHGYVGLAYSSHLCDSYAVNIVECVGGSTRTGYIMAHELAHNFGIGHDSGAGGENNPCMKFDDYDGSIGWTPCNRYDFEHAYAAELWGQGCLEDISRPCTEFTCENGGTCQETENGGFSCSCPSSITGSRCEKNPVPICIGGNNCCTPENKCKEWEGNCNDDDDCINGLICGRKNCPRKYGYDWDVNDNCCFKPDLKTTTTCDSMTVDGSGESGKCVFPFYFNGTKYNHCANADDAHERGRWCSFDTIDSKSWGYCTKDCPIIGTCQAKSLNCPPIIKGSAKRQPGKNGTCAFPFKYKGHIYFECIEQIDYAGMGWCAFDSEYKNGEWGYCAPECPKNHDNPCDGIVCNVANETCVDGICKCGNACSCEGRITGSFCDSDNSKCKCSANEDACNGDLKCDTTDGKCHLCIGGSGCCTKDHQCDVGEGDCNHDSGCKQGLRCGVSNCGKCDGLVGSDWHWENDWDIVNSGKCGFWGVDDDCCYDPSKSCPREHPNGVDVDCPENHFAFGGHCYFPSFLDEPKNVKLQTWDDAKEYCRKLSSNELIYDLISIQSEEEHAFMIENNWSDVYVEFKASFMIWIGLNDVEWEGHWKWSDGQNLICTRWALEEPNNYLGDEDCAVIGSSLNGWNDRKCSEKFAFICEGRPKND